MWLKPSDAHGNPALGSQSDGILFWSVNVANLNLIAYDAVLLGGISGPSIIPGDPDNSILIQKQIEAQQHFGQFSPDELNFIIDWIQIGAPEH